MLGGAKVPSIKMLGMISKRSLTNTQMLSTPRVVHTINSRLDSGKFELFVERILNVSRTALKNKSPRRVPEAGLSLPS